MANRMAHTPEGVRDIGGEEYRARKRVQESIAERMLQYGFSFLKPPTFEYFETFAEKISGWRAKDLYKFFDKEGNTLVLRPDFTPQIARFAAAKLEDGDRTLRFCYEGDTFVNTSDLQGKLKESTQMGAELIGVSDVSSDAEMIALLIDSLLSSGLKDFQISIGHAAFFHGICVECGIDESTEDAIRAMIAENNYFAAEREMIERGFPERYREILLKISDFVGDAKELSDFYEETGNETSKKAVDHLRGVYEALQKRSMQSYVSFDLGMLSGHNYYTGVTFEAYTYGVGDAIAKGGRYDKLLTHFGQDAPAIGFAVIIDDLMKGLK